MKKEFRHYREDIRKTFIIYALIPTLLIIFMGYPFLYRSFLHTISRHNEANNLAISSHLEDSLTRYVSMANAWSQSGQITGLFEPLQDLPKTEVYEEIYSFLSTVGIKANCFIVDSNAQCLIKTNEFIPDYLDGSDSVTWGVVRRMNEKPHEVVIERHASFYQSSKTMCIGKAVVKDGNILGYIVFDVPERSLMLPLSENYSTASVVTDRFGYAFASTLNRMFDDSGKLAESMRGQTGKITVDGKSHYSTSTSILDGKVIIYTFTDISYLDYMFILVWILLAVMCLALTAMILISSKKFAQRKTKTLDDMIIAIENVQGGNLNMRLNVNTQDEFQLFADAYNQMLANLNELIKDNQEIAKQTAISEIKQLESQFNPHFLFNTLEMIKYMVAINPAYAKEIIVGLSEILRYSINNTLPDSSLESDLRYTEHYLTIQQYRFGESLCCSIDIVNEALDCIVPKLIIQPIVENAITYGFQKSKRLNVDIRAVLQDGDLILTIDNDGAGMGLEKLKEMQDILSSESNHTNHVGLYNVHRRIQLMYGQSYGVTITSKPDEGTCVKITLPALRGDKNV